MPGQLGREVAEIGVRLLDDAYMAWLVAETECEQAMRAWLDRTRGNHGDAYFSYRAALDREEAAARDLQRVSELAEACRDRLGQHGASNVLD